MEACVCARTRDPGSTEARAVAARKEYAAEGPNGAPRSGRNSRTFSAADLGVALFLASLDGLFLDFRGDFRVAVSSTRFFGGISLL